MDTTTEIKHENLAQPPQWVRELHPNVEEKMKSIAIKNSVKIAVDYNDPQLARECYTVTMYNDLQLLLWAVYYQTSDAMGLPLFVVKISIHL